MMKTMYEEERLTGVDQGSLTPLGREPSRVHKSLTGRTLTGSVLRAPPLGLQ